MNQNHIAVGVGSLGAGGMLATAMAYHFGLPEQAASADAGLALLVLGGIYSVARAWLARRQIELPPLTGTPAA